MVTAVAVVVCKNWLLTAHGMEYGYSVRIVCIVERRSEWGFSGNVRRSQPIHCRALEPQTNNSVVYVFIILSKINFAGEFLLNYLWLFATTTNVWILLAKSCTIFFFFSRREEKKINKWSAKAIAKITYYIFLFTNKMRDKFVIENQVHLNIVRHLVEVTARALKDAKLNSMQLHYNWIDEQTCIKRWCNM